MIYYNDSIPRPRQKEYTNSIMPHLSRIKEQLEILQGDFDIDPNTTLRLTGLVQDIRIAPDSETAVRGGHLF